MQLEGIMVPALTSGVVDSLTPTGKVGTVSIEGLGWGEVDFLTDVEAATKLTDGWV